MRIKDRLRDFALQHGLTHEQMAAKLNTPYGTFKKWMCVADTQPPGCLLTLLDILENVPEARKYLKLGAKK